MSDEDKRKFFADNPRLEQFSERIANYCEMSEDERDDVIENFVEEHKTELRDYIKENKMERMHDDKLHMDYDRLCII